MNKRLHITLGAGWERFVPHRSNETMRFLGVVRQGPQFGALAELEDGSYVQLNGDWITPLNTSRVKHELKQARTAPKKAWAERPQVPAGAAPPPAATVQVTVRKRRVVQLPKRTVG
jgi:hypothetical protein